VKEFARKKGADLVGVASIDRFKNAPEHHHPHFFLPKARAVVVVALRVNRSILQTVAQGRENLSYGAFGFKVINEELDLIAYHLANFIEKLGYDSYPIPANAPRDTMFRWGLSSRHAAVAAGMGQMGISQIFLTPEFGPRQKLVSIITDAPLEPDPLIKHDLCDRCNSCIKICPSGALSGERMDGIEIGGVTFEYSHQTRWKCAFACGGLMSKGTFATTDNKLPETRPSPHEMFAYFNRLAPPQDLLERESGARLPWCAKCLAICSLHHETKQDKSPEKTSSKGNLA
jgi:epoxyqueuosine reductase QueG